MALVIASSLDPCRRPQAAGHAQQLGPRWSSTYLDIEEGHQRLLQLGDGSLDYPVQSLSEAGRAVSRNEFGQRGRGVPAAIT